jgi:hypothetical protein
MFNTNLFLNKVNAASSEFAFRAKFATGHTCKLAGKLASDTDAGIAQLAVSQVEPVKLSGPKVETESGTTGRQQQTISGQNLAAAYAAACGIKVPAPVPLTPAAGELANRLPKGGKGKDAEPAVNGTATA